MPCWSSLRPEIAALKCSEVAHPWTENCLLATGYLWVDCCIGSSGFFGFLYLCQYVSTVLKKKKKKAELKDFFRKHIRSTFFGATLSASIFAFHCLLRRLIGKYTYPTLVFLPGLLGGFSVFLEHRKGRELYANAFANCCTELCLRLLEHSKIIKWNPNVQTVIFMAFTSLLSYLISWTKFDLNYFWFFLPPKVNEARNGDCFHEGGCKKHLMQLFVMYSSTGLILQTLRLFLNNFKNLGVFFSSLVKPKTFKLAAFLGGYVVVYQAIRCYLYQKERQYSSTHDGLAGFLAGLAFRFQPTIPIFNSAIITTVQVYRRRCFQILVEAGHRKKILPNIHYLELLFSISCGVLFHYRILSEFSPRLTIYFMSGVTHGFSDWIHQHFKDTLKRFNLKSLTC